MPEPTVLTRLVAAAGFIPPGLIWGLALLAGVAGAVRSARRAGLDARAMYWASVAALAVAIAGSHLLGLVVYRSANAVPEVWWHIWEGGKTFFGGFVGGAVGLLGALALMRRPLLAYADAAAPAVGLGYAIGRVACFLNGDDHGVVTSGWFTVQYPQGTEAFYAHALSMKILSGDPLSLPVVPVQLLASALGLLIFVVLRRPRPAGERLALLCVLYGAGRWCLELVRGDFERVVGPLSLHQALGLLLVTIGVALFFWSSWRRTAPAFAEAAGRA